MLVKLESEDDSILLSASLSSTRNITDKVIILDTSIDQSKTELCKTICQNNCNNLIFLHDSNIINRDGFAAARNLMLNVSDNDCYILWQDADEVHFTDQLLILRQLVDHSLSPLDDVSMHFVHFCLGSNMYEKFEKRTTIFRRTPDTHWENKVHEKIVHSPGIRSAFASACHYHHYGYVRDQETVFNRWRQYAILSGEENPSVDQEYPDHQVLEHRRKSLLPYFGEYPAAIPADWITRKLIND